MRHEANQKDCDGAPFSTRTRTRVHITCRFPSPVKKLPVAPGGPGWQSKPRGRSWNQRASDDDPTFRCAVYADLLVADQVADEQRRARVGRTSLEHRIGEWGETRRIRVRDTVAHNRAIDPTLGLGTDLRL